MPVKRKDLTGMVFGKLTVLVYSHTNRFAYWRCKCECGNETVVSSGNLKSGGVKSCGCLVGEIGKQTIKSAYMAITKHNKSKTRLYNIWTNMKQRCGNFKNKDYNRYGGRGIKVCPEWKNDFQAFYDWAMANGYKQDLQLDRIDNDKGYSPENSRWVNCYTQANNRRKNVYVTFNNKTQTVSQWAKEFGVHPESFRNQLKKGKTIEQIVNSGGVAV
jgi:hypothetical protein